MIDAKTAKKHLDMMRSLKSYYKFIDMHVHPFEVLFNECSCHPLSSQTGTICTSDFLDEPPCLKDISCGQNFQNQKVFSLFQGKEFLRKKFLRLYRHSGPASFLQSMDFSCIDQVLLLPVAPLNGPVDPQLSKMMDIFGSEKRFVFAWSVPNTINNSEVTIEAQKAMTLFQVKAVKVHSNVTGLDLGSGSGKERLESILEACDKLRLPLIVHGGRSPALENQAAGSYAAITNLMHIDWSISSSPVVIAHAGCYGCTLQETESEVLPLLSKLLSSHDNLMVDLSGLQLDFLILLFSRIDQKRILFGSDALYDPQWESVVKLLAAITATTKRIEEAFVQVAALNPAILISNSCP